MATIIVLGEGAWGTALATVFAENGHQVIIWCHDATRAKEIKEKHTNIRYLPGITLSSSIQSTTEYKDIEKADYIVEAIPVPFLRTVLQEVKPFYKNQPLIVTSKGIEQKTSMLPSQIAQDILGVPSYAVISGPSFAADVACKTITAIEVGASSTQLRDEVIKLIRNEYMQAYESDDPIGMQVCGALKNCIALAVGILEGAGYSENTKIWLLMRGLHDTQVLIKHYGGNQKTSLGLSGIADTMLTSLGEKSRNREFGRRIGAGATREEALQNMSGVVEGLSTLETIKTAIDRDRLYIPFFSLLYGVVFERHTVADFVIQQKDLPIML